MKRYFSAFILVILAIAITQAQQQSSQEAQKTNKGNQEVVFTEPAYAKAPFDMGVDKLPPNYTGHDIAAIYAKVEKAVPPKDEFESSQQYNARLKSLVMDEIYAVKIEETGIVSLAYDADSQTMKATIKVRPVAFYENPNSPSLITGITTKKGREAVSSYIGQNNYGATRNVTKSVGEDFNVAIEKVPDSLVEDRPLSALMPTDLKLAFPLAPEKAREVKTKLGVLIVCKLKSPFRVYPDFNVTKPTFSDPTDSLRMHKSLYVELKGIWIFNTESGDVIKKFAVEK